MGQLSPAMQADIKAKLQEISGRVLAAEQMAEYEQSCILGEITLLKRQVFELEALISYYYFQSALLPYVEGLDEIARALTVLSAKRHGALMAIERNDGLDPYIQSCNITGTTIGAQVSASLLQSIFYPGNPLHDGAVLIREGQIVSAGCVLPLSEEKYTREGEKIGTRHRAALGLSEKCDALVVVVSEETGKVSFALAGALYTMTMEVSGIDNVSRAGV